MSEQANGNSLCIPTTLYYCVTCLYSYRTFCSLISKVSLILLIKGSLPSVLMSLLSSVINNKYPCSTIFSWLNAVTFIILVLKIDVVAI